MNNLVFLEPNKIDAIPFTASDVIAQYAEVQHHTVTKLIQKHESDLAEFGRVRFKIDTLQTNGGVQQIKIYHLNEQQATLLMTYLKNTEPVRKFKKELVKQFFQMREELTQRQINRIELKPIRRALTDVIQDNPEHSQWDYKHFTDLAYIAAVGMTAVQLRKQRNAPKSAPAIDYMTSAEIERVAKMQNRIGVLYEMGLDYHMVKSLLIVGQARIA